MEIVHFVKTGNITERIEALFVSEKQKLEALFLNAFIEHVGGTSVPGAILKGDLDINVRVESQDFQEATETLKRLYEVNQLDNWTPGFASFKDEPRDLGIQLTAIGSKDDYFVAQRDYLRNHPRKVEELNTLKEKFEGRDMNEYREEKRKFFENLNS